MDNTLFQLADDGSFTLFPDRQKDFKRISKYALFVMLPYNLLLYCLASILAYWPLSPLLAAPMHRVAPDFAAIAYFCTIVFLAVYLILYFHGKRQVKPLIIVNTDGIIIDTMGYRVGLLKWEEIESISTFTLIYKYLGINIKDAYAVCRRIGWRKGLNLRATLPLVSIFRSLGITMSQILVLQDLIPVPTDELINHINQFRKCHHIEKWQLDMRLEQEGSSWPPAPKV